MTIAAKAPRKAAAVTESGVSALRICQTEANINQQAARPTRLRFHFVGLFGRDQMMTTPAIAETPPKKRIAIFLDGTWNTVDDNTNVWRLRSLCAPRGSDGTQQLIYYDVGVNGAIGGMFGKGLSENITEAYKWLIDQYNEGDEIFIFGFSRGAFTARSLAGFIAKCGLLKPGAPLSVGQLYQRYRAADDRTIYFIHDRVADGTLQATIEDKWMIKYSQRIPIKFIGVWDTVGALGVPVFHIPGISRSTLGFLHTGLRIPIQHGFHALAIDEHRYAFQPTLWTAKKAKNSKKHKLAPPRSIASVEQRWFVGAHANVGGGCHSDLLAQAPLRWIMDKAALHGLVFRNALEIDESALTEPISNSYKEFMRGIYRGFSWPYNRPLDTPPAEEPEFTNYNVNETIDASVFERWRVNPTYRPESLKAWAEKHNTGIEKLTTSVRADNPKEAAPG